MQLWWAVWGQFSFRQFLLPACTCSVGPLRCLVNVNYRLLICCTLTSRTVPSSLFCFLCLQISLVSNVHPDTRVAEVFAYLGSLVQWCCGWGGTLQTISLACVGSACPVWTTLGLPQLKVACASWVYTGQAPGALQWHSPKRALPFVDFLGLSHSGPRLFRKGTDSVGHAFCALPWCEQLRRPGAW